MSESSLGEKSIRVNKHHSKITIFLLTEMLIILCEKKDVQMIISVGMK